MLYINNINYRFNNDISIKLLIAFLETFNYVIPKFCYHNKLSTSGNCRMCKHIVCLVELKNSVNPVVSCCTILNDSMVVYTDTLLIRIIREYILKFLLINHPLDCPICDQAGECDLQDLTLIYGSGHSNFRSNKKSIFNKNVGPFIKTQMNRCISCTRCVRYSSELNNTYSFNTLGRSGYSEIGNYYWEDLNPMMNLSYVHGNVIDLCPVGVLTAKPNTFTFTFTFRSYSISTFKRLDVKKNTPNLLKQLYFYLFYLYYFFQFDVFVVRCSYELSLHHIEIDPYYEYSNVTKQFYSSFMQYNSLTGSKQLELLSSYVHFILDERLDSFSTIFQMEHNIKGNFTMKTSLLDSNLHFCCFSPSYDSIHLDNWIYILKSEHLTYLHTNNVKYNVFVCFYTYTYSTLQYYDDINTYNFNVRCSITYDLHFKNTLSYEGNKHEVMCNSDEYKMHTSIENYVKSFYQNTLSSSLKYSLYKLLYNLNKNSEEHLDLALYSKVSVSPLIISRNSFLFKSINKVRKYSTYMKRSYMKKVMSIMKDNSVVKLTVFYKKIEFVNPKSTLSSISKNFKQEYYDSSVKEHTSLLEFKKLPISKLLTYKQFLKIIKEPHQFLYIKLGEEVIYAGLTSTYEPSFKSNKTDLLFFIHLYSTFTFISCS